MDHTKESPQISLLGTSAMLFEAPGAFDLSHQRRIWSLARVTQDWPGVLEAVPGMTNLMLTFEEPIRDPGKQQNSLLAAWARAEDVAGESRTFEFPVVYGGEGGPDLDHMAEHTGLSREEVVAVHAGRSYTVFALGSHPGYAYLGTVDPKLFIPRRKVPRVSIPAGAVSIGGWQTGASASAGPSGWHTIGRTLVKFFDPKASEPALLAPGDTMRFAIERIVP